MFNFKIKKIGYGEKSYPRALKKIKKPPRQIYYRGKWRNRLFTKSIAIVGSRRMTRYGSQVVDQLVGELVSQGVTTISGFMYGVDSQVHQRTVEYGGRTVAVFGCGLDTIYPPENKKLYTSILSGGGLVLSEYKPDARPHLWKFPQRNRIIAGLASLGVLVIEAAEKSGSLVTAKIALEQDKKLFAVPGPVTSLVSAGTNGLIKQGKAQLVTSAADILGQTLSVSSEARLPELSEKEKRVYKALKNEPLNTDELVLVTGEDLVALTSTLSLMALKGIITESAGKYYLAVG